MKRLPAILRTHLSYANAMSALAIFFVLAGGSALAVAVKKNSVTSATVKNGSLRSADLADGNGVSGADVADGSLGGADLAAGSVGSAKVADRSVTGADLADGSIGNAQLGAGAVVSGKLASDAVRGPNIADQSLGGSDFAPDTVTGRDVVESSLGKVPTAAALQGSPATSFLAGAILVQGTFPDQVGIPLGDGTFRITASCAPNEGEVLAGGPQHLNATTTLVESFPKDNTWTVRINPHGISDPFAVRVACALENF